MKKRIALVGAIVGVMSLVAFVAISQTNGPVVAFAEKPASESWSAENAALLMGSAPANFHYQIGSRFYATITKEDLDQATSLSDILPQEADWSSYPIQRITVKRLDTDAEIIKEGGELILGGLSLNTSQIALLKACRYSESFRLTANTRHGDELTYFITITPEKEATYAGGSDALIAYLKRNSVGDIIKVVEERLKPGKIMFTVNTQGGISDIRLSESSGYSTVDETMMELIKKTSGSWEPATNAEGVKVDQELMFSFGRMGC